MNAELEAYIYDKKIGTLLLERGKIYFEYEENFKASGLEISPLKMPLESTRLYTNSDNLDYYGGLPGVFHDSLPDKFGTKVIERYFESKKIPAHELSVIQKLMFVGKKGMGAIRYKPNEKLLGNHDVQEAIELDSFVKSAKHVVEGKAFDVVDNMFSFMDSAASAGGARAKAVVGFDEESHKMIYGLREKLPEPYAHWLLKFDAVNDEGKSSDYTKLEYVYMKMAEASGITIPKVVLLQHKNLVHFMIKRFDRVNDERVHLHTVAGMTHSNINVPGHYSYDMLMRLTRMVTGEQREVEEQFRRMVFNVMARNQDDHAKNFSFLMDRSGRWQVSPAYDITYANGNGYTREHQLSIGGKTREIKKEDLMALAHAHSISNTLANEVIEKTKEALSHFSKNAEALEVNRQTIKRIESALNFV